MTSMRIFQTLEASTNTLVPQNQTWLRNLHEPLVDMGHDVLLFSATPGRIAMQRHDDAARATFSQQLLDAVRMAHTTKPLDLFFAYLMDGMVNADVIDEIRRLGVPTCNFSCNNIHQFGLVDDISPHFDLNLYAEKAAAPKFAAIGSTGLWWPMASDPKYFHPPRWRVMWRFPLWEPTMPYEPNT